MTRPLLTLFCIAVLAVSPAEAQYARPSLAASTGVHVSPDALHPPFPSRSLAAISDLHPPLLPTHAAFRFSPLRPTSTPLSLRGRYTNRHTNRVTNRYTMTGLPETSSSDGSGRTLLVVGLSTLAAAGVAAAVLLLGNDDESDTPPIAAPPGRP